MSWFYIIIIIILLYFTGLYNKLPEPIPVIFDIVGMLIPGQNSVNDDIEGIYESDFKQHGFHKHFMITVDPQDDSKYISIKYRGSKSETDDPVKLLEKEIRDMKHDALDVSCIFKTPVVYDKKEKTYDIFGTTATRDSTTLIFTKDNKTIKYFKIRDIA